MVVKILDTGLVASPLGDTKINKTTTEATAERQKISIKTFRVKCVYFVIGRRGIAPGLFRDFKTFLY